MAVSKILWIVFAVIAVFSFLTFSARSETQIEIPMFVQEDYLNHTARMIPYPQTRSEDLPMPMVAQTWTGLGADENWNTVGNWSTGVPNAGDTVTFNATSVKNCTVNVATNSLTSFAVSAGYTGTITVAADQTATWGATTIATASINKSTFNVTVANLTMSGGDLVSTSGSMIVTGNLSISNAASAISFGSGTFEFRGSYTNNTSTDNTIWNAGTAAVSFTSSGSPSFVYGGSVLNEPEFYNVTFQSSNSTGSIATFTMSNRDLWVLGSITVTDNLGETRLVNTNLSITADSILVSGYGMLVSTTIQPYITSNLTVSGNGILSLRTANVRSFSITASVSTFSIVPYDWTSYSPPSSISFSINPSSSSAVMSFIFENMIPNGRYDLRRDSILTKSSFADSSGELSFAISGGWSNHTITISQTETSSNDFLPFIIAFILFLVFAIIGMITNNGLITIVAGIFGAVICFVAWDILGGYAFPMVAFVMFVLAVGVGELLEG